MKLLLFLALVSCVVTVTAQRNVKPASPGVPMVVVSPSSSSPAYAELLLRKTELAAELESLVLEYTEEYPKVRESRYAITLLDRDLARISAVKPIESGKLTLALGKLMVRRIELETDLWSLLRTYKDEHPDVKRVKKKVDIYDAAIKEILG